MVMIEKDPGNPRIERLRVIDLFEADYNLSETVAKTNGVPRRGQQLFQWATTWIMTPTPSHECVAHENTDVWSDKDTTPKSYYVR
jgi:hypothetical protein